MRKGLGFRMESHLNLRQEDMVAFQSKQDPFIAKFDAILDRIREKIKTGWLDLEVTRDKDTLELQKLINDRFKMNVHLVTDGTSAAVIPFFSTDNNVLMREYFRQTSWLQSEKDFFKGLDVASGYVDMEKGTLGGDFSKGQSTLYLNFNKLIPSTAKGGYQLTNRETIAVAAHELGHIFYPLVYATHLDKSNVILESARRELSGNNPDRLKIVQKTVEKLTKGDATKISADLCSSDPDIVTKAALKLIGEKTLQHQTDAKYSNTNFEMLADNFATRFGLGKELVTALEKMTPGGVRYGDFIRAIAETTAIVTQIMAILAFVKVLADMNSLVGKFVLSVLWAFTQGLTIAVFFYVMVRMSGEAGRDYTYDDLVKRYGRIRNQLIADIKGRALTKGDATRAIEQIEFIGNLIKQGQNWRTPLDFIFNTFNPNDRRAKDSITRQQALESLVNNELFLSSLKLTKAAG